MSDYQIVITQSASKELAKLPATVIRRIQSAVNDLVAEPRPVNCKKLKGYKDLYRIRVSDYRVVYRIEDQQLIIEVVKIGNRKDVYS